jgi:hypothetical protein
MSKAADESWKGSTLNFDCKSGEAIFFCLVQSVMLRSVKETEAIVDDFKQATDHVSGVNDDRALTLVCALLLENSVDRCLDVFAPGYSHIAEDRDLTFSLKASILKALALLPAQIIDAITPIRKIRNCFAHDLDTKTFQDVDPALFAALETHRQRLLPKSPPANSRPEAVVDTTKNVLIGLGLFRLHIDVLRRFLNTQEFREFFNAYCKANYDKEL